MQYIGKEQTSSVNVIFVDQDNTLAEEHNIHRKYFVILGIKILIRKNKYDRNMRLYDGPPVNTVGFKK